MAGLGNVSIVTLGVSDVEASARFYAALGWPRSTDSVEGTIHWFGVEPELPRRRRPHRHPVEPAAPGEACWSPGPDGARPEAGRIDDGDRSG